MRERRAARQAAQKARREAAQRRRAARQAAQKARREAAQRRRRERQEAIRKRREEAARKKREEAERKKREAEERKRAEEERKRLEEEERRRRQDTLVISVGINYIGQSGQLMGCINDSNHFVRSVRGVANERIHDVVQLTDNLPPRSERYPTRANIQRVLTDAARDAQSGKFKHILFHYSGHGGRAADTNGDEADGVDETLVPVNFASAGMISDDWLFGNVINKLPPNTLFFGLIDACHSGTAMDLRHRVTEVTADSLTFTLANPNASESTNAMMISGCRDAEFSYDVWDVKYGPSGAMTGAFLDQLDQRKTPVADIVERMRAALRAKGYPQTPQLSASKEISRDQRMYGLGEY
jgi:flagellar biosynthesis GTPase FlhF